MSATTESRASGWVMFAITMFILAGVLNAIYGLMMLFNSTWVVFTTDGAWLVDIATWGWITLLVAAIEFLAAWGISGGKTWGRVTGIIIATIAAVNALFTITIYPIWGIVMLALAVLIIYGLTVHGDEIG